MRSAAIERAGWAGSEAGRSGSSWTEVRFRTMTFADSGSLFREEAVTARSTTWLRLKPRSPLLIGRLKADSAYLTTLPYIPGRILRGAWAEYRRIQNQLQTLASDARRIQIWNFHPAPAGARYSLPLPLSAWTCKSYPGFRPGGHGVLDSLIPRLAYALLERSNAPSSLPFQTVCDLCKARTTPLGGYYACDPEGRFERIRIPLQFQTKIAMSRRRRAAMEGMLYQVTAIAPHEPLTLIGCMHGPADLIRELREAIARVGIGALTRRGYGEVEVEEAQPPAYPPLQERVERFNRLLRDLWKDLSRLVPANPPPELPAGLYFTVDLLAPGIFREEPLGSPTLVPTLRLAGQVLRPIFWITRPLLVSGWSTAWGLPKPIALAAAPGSSYVFCWEQTNWEALEALEQDGIGERTDEGFGELLICHPFHTEVEPV